jgi:hypothetical protein
MGLSPHRDVGYYGASAKNGRGGLCSQIFRRKGAKPILQATVLQTSLWGAGRGLREVGRRFPDRDKVPIVKVVVCREVERRFWMGLK